MPILESVSFDKQMDRIRLVTQTRTQVELANFLGIRQSSVSNAKRRGTIPADWLLTILRIRNVHPEWILTGEGHCYLSDPASPGCHKPKGGCMVRQEETSALCRLSSLVVTDEAMQCVDALREGNPVESQEANLNEERGA